MIPVASIGRIVICWCCKVPPSSGYSLSLSPGLSRIDSRRINGPRAREQGSQQTTNTRPTHPTIACFSNVLACVVAIAASEEGQQRRKRRFGHPHSLRVRPSRREFRVRLACIRLFRDASVNEECSRVIGGAAVSGRLIMRESEVIAR